MQTTGEYRVGTDFNPSGDLKVERIKSLAAELIDLIGSLQYRGIPEVMRLKTIAMTDIESGAMWAVKAATKKVHTNEESK